MKLFLVFYWLIGCALMGLASAHHQRTCPYDEVRSHDMLAAVAVWPAFLVGAFSLREIDVRIRCERDQ